MSEFSFKSFGNSKQNILLCDIDECYICNKLKQTLEEIREIAKKTISLADEICCHECDSGAIDAEKIIEKINEVIDE